MTKKIKLFIATSLDGFIASSNGSVDWLFTDPDCCDDDNPYPRFYESVDTLVMGSNTFRQIIGFDVAWPYSGKEVFVATRKPLVTTIPQVYAIHQDLLKHIHELKKKPGKDIWLVGGAEINTIFLKAGLIDEMMLFIHPVALGKGIPLFTEAHFSSFDTKHTRAYSSGLVQIHWVKKNERQ